MISSPTDAIGIVDEAGLTGLVRNLTPGQDKSIGLVAALMLPDADMAKWESVFAPPYEAFRAAAPAGAKLHITDAFTSGSADWAAAAERARQDIIDRIQRLGLLIIYTARRGQVARTTHDMLLGIAERADAARPAHISVSRRPSGTRHVAECYQGVVSIVDVLAATFGCRHIALYSDTIDPAVLADMEAAADRLRSVSRRVKHVHGYDRLAKQRVTGTITCSVDLLGIDVSRVGALQPLGKSSSLVFASDVVCNALLHHLRGLPDGTPLNTMRGAEGWVLAPRVFAPTADMADIYNIV